MTWKEGTNGSRTNERVWKAQAASACDRKQNNGTAVVDLLFGSPSRAIFYRAKAGREQIEEEESEYVEQRRWQPGNPGLGQTTGGAGGL